MAPIQVTARTRRDKFTIETDPFTVGTTMPTENDFSDWWLAGTGGTRNNGPRFNYDPFDHNVTPSDGRPWTYIVGDWAPTAGYYSHVWVQDGTIKPAAEGVIVEDFVQRPAPIPTPTPSGQKYGVQIPSAIPFTGVQGVHLSFGDIGCPVPIQTYNHSTGIRPTSLTTRRLMVWGYVDGMMPYGQVAGTKGRWYDFGSCFATGQHFSDDGGNHSDGTHNDGCQSEGNMGLELNGTRLHGQWTSGILVTNNVAGGYDFCHLYDVWLAAEKGAKVNFAGASIGGIATNRCKLIRNSASLDINVAVTNRNPAFFGCTGTVGNVNDWVPDGSGNHNVYSDTGLPCRYSNG
jgi:hypothetical protein